MYNNYLHSLNYAKVRSQGVTLGRFTTSIQNTYSVWVMENYNGADLILLIDEDQNEITGISNANTGRLLFLHPRSIDGAFRVWNT